MLLTIDSTEPLAKVAAVVGALYGVELVVGGGTEVASSGRRRSRAIASSTTAKRSAGRARKGGQKVDPKIVRQWAVDQGMTVSTRGQLPKAVLVAYSESNA